MEIERKFLIKSIPFEVKNYTRKEIEQGYLCTEPVLRIRRKDDHYIFTYKSAGLMSREEIEAPLTLEAYEKLRPKCDGAFISKTRYLIPFEQLSSLGNKLTIELDIFHGDLEGLILAEVEFHSEEEANAFSAPDWFTVDVTNTSSFHNSHMCQTEPTKTLATMRELLKQK